MEDLETWEVIAKNENYYLKRLKSKKDFIEKVTVQNSLKWFVHENNNRYIPQVPGFERRNETSWGTTWTTTSTEKERMEEKKSSYLYDALLCRETMVQIDLEIYQNKDNSK